MKRRLFIRMVLAYVIFGVVGFIVISSFISGYNQRYLEKEEAASLRRECTAIGSSYSKNYMSSDMTLKEFQSQLSDVSAYLDADIYIINTKGRVMVNSVAYATPDNTETIENFDILDFGNGSYNIGTFYGKYSEDVLSVYTSIASEYKTQSYVIICKPVSSISDMQYDLLNGSYLTLIILFALSMIVLLVYLFAVHIPMKKIVKAATAYAGGKFDQAIEMHRNDEIGFLADTMNYMALELDSLEEDQRKFVSNVSHDFRSPLTSIKGYAEAIVDGTIPPELQEKYLNVIIFETERLEKLTQSLLELNKLEGKGSYLDLSNFDINELIKRTVLSFEGRCREKGIAFDLVLTGEQMNVRADKSKIDQVLHNLIDNAIKFSNDDSKIRIETTMKNEKLFVSVKDSGIGIPKDSIKKIWERFYKTDLSRGKDKKGTGLGLAIVKEIIHAHHENINVISTEGVGTEFIFSLPLRENTQ